MPLKTLFQTIVVCASILLGVSQAAAQGAALSGGYPQVLVETTAGEIVIELDARRAPLSAQHFLKLVKDGYYTGTIFHRVISGFVIQGGGHTIDFTPKTGADTVFNESGNGMSNQRGTVALARTNDPHSADSQFFINLADNSRLDPRRDRWGYAVFGQVIEGMNIVDDIAASPTGPGGPFEADVPTLPILVESMKLLSQEDIAARAQAAIEAAEAELELLENQQCPPPSSRPCMSLRRHRKSHNSLPSSSAGARASFKPCTSLGISSRRGLAMMIRTRILRPSRTRLEN